MKAVIMAGGKGTRFWPRSTEQLPKQFLNLTSERETMLQQTYGRFRSFLDKKNIYVVVSPRYLDYVREQLPELDEWRIIVEPEQRDTAPCIALAARHMLDRGLDEVIVTAPSDQYMEDEGQLAEVLHRAEAVAQRDGAVVTLGIAPTRAETGYGYIETMEEEPDRIANRPGMAHKVKAFIEKPDLKRAEELIRQPNMFWNSGIFIWKPSTIAHYMQLYQPAIWDIFELRGEKFLQAYSGLAKLSIDYAIMEKIREIFMIPIRFEWDDVGVWTSLERVFQRDEDGNLLSGEVYGADVADSIIMAGKMKAVVIGVKDLIVVASGEGLLICHKSQEQRIKEVLSAMERKAVRKEPK